MLDLSVQFVKYENFIFSFSSHCKDIFLCTVRSVEISNCGKCSLTDVNTIIWVSCLLAHVQNIPDCSLLIKLNIESGMILRGETAFSSFLVTEDEKNNQLFSLNTAPPLPPVLLNLQNLILTLDNYQHCRNVNRRRLVVVKTSQFFATPALEVFLKGKLETT